MKILVPTDFSRLSNTASFYAAKMASELNAEVLLIHVVHFDSPPRAHASLRVADIEDKMADNAKHDCIQLANRLKAEFPALQVSYTIVKGYPVEEAIENYVIHNPIDFIVMGTKGASGWSEVLIGSNAAAVVSSSSLPVIIVPEHARFFGIKKIVYASNILRIEPELNELIKFAKLFSAQIHLIHVLSPSSNIVINAAKMEADIKEKFQDAPVIVRIIHNADVLCGIDEYVADEKADLLALFNRKHNLFERVFGNSIARQMAFHAWIPFVSVKKTD